MHISDIPEITRLSVPEKILLVEELWDTIASAEEEIPVPQSHIEELERRFESHRMNPGNLLTLDELRGRIAKRK
jgi:putative addiction module component (TIGR02574 family)